MREFALLLASAAEQWLTLLASASVKGTILLVAVGAMTIAMRHASASLRHAAWATAMLGVLLLPALALLLPSWTLPAGAPSARVATALDAITAWPAGARSGAGAVALVLGWALGALLVGGRFALGHLLVRRDVRLARREVSGAWRTSLRAAVRSSGVRQRVTLLRAPGLAAPVTWGVLRPRIVLPDDARDWPASLRQVVLLHELAHVRRRDGLVQLLEQVAVTLFWFHPLVWVAAVRLHLERELACDEDTVRAGADADGYAAALVELARAARRSVRGAHAPALSFAGRSRLAVRVRALVDSPRRTATVPARSGALAAAILFAIAPLAAVRADRAPGTGAISVSGSPVGAPAVRELPGAGPASFRAPLAPRLRALLGVP